MWPCNCACGRIIVRVCVSWMCVCVMDAVHVVLWTEMRRLAPAVSKQSWLTVCKKCTSPVSLSWQQLLLAKCSRLMVRCARTRWCKFCCVLMGRHGLVPACQQCCLPAGTPCMCCPAVQPAGSGPPHVRRCSAACWWWLTSSEPLHVPRCSAACWWWFTGCEPPHVPHCSAACWLEPPICVGERHQWPQLGQLPVPDAQAIHLAPVHACAKDFWPQVMRKGGGGGRGCAGTGSFSESELLCLPVGYGGWCPAASIGAAGGCELTGNLISEYQMWLQAGSYSGKFPQYLM